MTAQQQLATLLAAPDEAHSLFGGAALKSLRDHGPAIAGLVTAAMVLERWRIHWSKLRSDPAEQVRADLATRVAHR